jgi:FdhD protein
MIEPTPDNQPADEGTIIAPYTTITRSGWSTVNGEVINERLVSIFVNGQELATIMCTPRQQDALAFGFLANEGVISSIADVRALHVCPSGGCVDVWLSTSNFEPPRRMILTSGCGGGVTFDDLSAEHEPLHSDLRVTPGQLWNMMDALNQSAALYSRSRGVHTSNLSDGEHPLLVAEDVGRHNTLDKLRGLALQQSVTTKDHILVTTGRVSSEMINKARRMEVPIIASRTSPTSLSLKLAQAWNITLIGYLRRNSMNVYANPDRVLLESMPVDSSNGQSRETQIDARQPDFTDD